MEAAPQQPLPPQSQGLEKSLTLWDLLAFGLGSIMGSGGFNLIGEGVKQGGPLFPAAIGIVAALFQGASKVYQEAYTMFKSNTAESDVVEAALGRPASLFTAVSILGFNIFSVSTILVFAAKNIFPKGQWHGQIGLALVILGAMTSFSMKGIDLNKQAVGFFSTVIVGLLVFASSIGLVEGLGPGGTSATAFPAALSSTPSFMKSILFFYFVLSGFDDLMKFVQETKDPDNDIPRSFYMSNGISTLLVVGVAYAFVHVLTMRGGGGRAPTENAIGMIIESALGPPAGTMVYWLGIFLMIVTAFVSFLAVSRYMYALPERLDGGGADAETKAGGLLGSLKALQELNAAKVPWRSVLLTFVLTAVGILMNHTETLVRITDVFLTLMLMMVSGAVAKLRWEKGEIPWIEGATAAGFTTLLFACCSPF